MTQRALTVGLRGHGVRRPDCHCCDAAHSSRGRMRTAVATNLSKRSRTAVPDLREERCCCRFGGVTGRPPPIA